jgi:S1-C subfamily serine protease
VYTLGYPRNEIVYGKGYISAETGFRGDSGSYQISVPVNPGNSGGPVIDSHGQVLGIITGKQLPSEDIAFAVKSSFLAGMLDSLPGKLDKYALLNSRSSLSGLSRVNQIKKLQPFIFLVKVYN